MVQLVTGDIDTAIKNIKEFDRRSETAKNKDGLQFGDSYKFRVVKEIDDLREKLFIFDAGLDDRLVELMKLTTSLIWIGPLKPFQKSCKMLDY